MDTYTRFDFLERNDGDFSIFDSNYYGVNSGAEVARIYVESNVRRAGGLDLIQQAQMGENVRTRAERVARLIEAAPELLAMVKRLSDLLFGLACEIGDGPEKFESLEGVDKANQLLARINGETGK